MAKAIFHKSQRVFVKPVGTWALIEQVIPHWVKDVDEPLRVSYDCGLGRRFEAFELVSEQTMRQHDPSPDEDDEDDLMLEQWRIDRKLVKWRSDMLVGTNPNPETYPVVVTDDGDWGGWRVTGSEFDRDPQRVEHQARMIVHTPDLLRVASRLADFAGTNPDDLPEELRPLAQRCALILRQVYQIDRDQVEAAAE